MNFKNSYLNVSSSASRIKKEMLKQKRCQVREINTELLFIHFEVNLSAASGCLGYFQLNSASLFPPTHYHTLYYNSLLFPLFIYRLSPTASSVIILFLSLHFPTFTFSTLLSPHTTTRIICFL